MPINTNYAEKMYAGAGGRVPPIPVEQVGVAGLTLKSKGKEGPLRRQGSLGCESVLARNCEPGFLD